MAEYSFRGHPSWDGKYTRYYCPQQINDTYTDKKTGTCLMFDDCTFQIGVEATAKAARKADIPNARKKVDFFECALIEGALTIKRPGEEPEFYEADPDDGVWDNEVIEYLQDYLENSSDLLDDLDDEDNWD